MSDLKISVVTFNNRGSIGDCLTSAIREASGKIADASDAIEVIDNGSTDGTPEHVQAAFPGVRVVVAEQNLGFGAAHNRVIAGTSARRVLLLNPDATLLPGALARLLQTLDEAEDLAAVGPRLDAPDGTPEVSYGDFPGVLTDARRRRRDRSLERGDRHAREALEAELARPFRPDWISGACMLCKTEALLRVGLFDERFFMYLEDVDLCLRLRDAGLAVAVEPRARALHERGGSQVDAAASRRHYRRSRLEYERKHGSRLGAFLYGTFRAPDGGSGG